MGEGGRACGEVGVRVAGGVAGSGREIRWPALRAGGGGGPRSSLSSPLYSPAHRALAARPDGAGQLLQPLKVHGGVCVCVYVWVGWARV